MKLFTAVVVVLLTSDGFKCAKILGLFPAPTQSHYILGSALMRGLAEKGHEVTFISPFVGKDTPKNRFFKEIVITGLLDEHERRMSELNFFEMEDVSMFLMLPVFVHMINDLTDYTLNHTNVQQLMKSEEKFDLVIVENFMNEAHKGMANHFNASLVLLSTIGPNMWVNMLVGNPSPPSYVVDAFLSYSSNMTFFERTHNTILYIYSSLLYHLYLFPSQKQIFDKYFPNGPDFYDVLYSASIVLLNSHPCINQAVPFVPSMIDIGGYHVQPPKNLPDDLRTFLDNAEEGVIYFSLGSHIKSANMPEEKRQAFLNTFSKLKEKVLWKWEADILPGQPKNVKIGKWLPQQDILAHPNVKLFITHGGLLSTTETIYHGVPVLAIPIGADQKLNAQRAVSLGFGLSLRYKEVSEETLSRKLDELLTNTKYSEEAKKRSQVFHDRMVKPMDTAIYWVEYVLRHGRSPHLRIAALDLPWWKYLLLDVTALIVVTVLVGLYIACKLTQVLFRTLFSKSKARKVKRQ